MRKYLNLGLKIKEARTTKGHTINALAELLKINKSYLSMMENGLRRPSEETLMSLAEYYSLDLNQLRILAGYEENNTVGKRRGVDFVENKTENKTSNIQIRVPENLPVLYSDSAFITSSAYGLVFDFAQNMGPTNNQNVVSRIGLSIEHGKNFLKILSKKIVDAERAQEESSVKRNDKESKNN